MKELTPIQKLHKAIAEYLAETRCEEHDRNAYLQSWFLGLGYTRSDQSVNDGISHSWRYVTSDDSPFSVLGVAELCLDDLRADLTARPEVSSED